MMPLKTADIHAQLGSSWPAILAQLGIDESFLRPKKSGPCPVCGGRDRYTFDNRKGRGDYICRGHGAGDGFDLLQRLHGWSFPEARRQVMAVAGLGGESSSSAVRGSWRDRANEPARGIVPAAIASGPLPTLRPPQRVLAALRGSCAVADCRDAVTYLASRGLWPLPEGCTLRAHPGLDCWNDGQRVGRYPGLVAEIVDLDGKFVTVHVTYLEAGAKICDHEPRKVLSKLDGHEGCAVRLMAATDTLAIAEGIETALSAAALFRIPAWAALNTSLLARFEPPPGVTRLVICADRDEAGLMAAGRLMERLQGRIRFELAVPKAPAKDFNDQLTRAGSANGTAHV